MTHDMPEGPQPSRPPLNSFTILEALKHSLPDALLQTGRTGLPLLIMPLAHVQGDPVGPVKIFYNLAPKQFRVVDEANPKYEFRCGTAQEVLDELGGLYGREYPMAQELLSLFLGV